MWAGDLPHRAFLFEYPPVAVVPFLVAGAVRHALALAVLAALATVAELTILWLVRDRPGAVRRTLVLSLLVFPLLSGGFDGLVVAVLVASTAMLARGDARGWWVAAVGTGAEAGTRRHLDLVPGASTHCPLGARRHRRRSRSSG